MIILEKDQDLTKRRKRKIGIDQERNKRSTKSTKTEMNTISIRMKIESITIRRRSINTRDQDRKNTEDLDLGKNMNEIVTIIDL